MKILAMETSSRPNGLTGRMTRAVLEGAQEAGAETELVALRDYTIECCRQCEETGWGECRTKGECVIDDDFSELVAKIEAADGFVLATPVYFGDLSEKAKAFTDRLRRISIGPERQSFLKGLPTIGLAAAGGSGGGTPSCLAAIEKVLTTPGCFVVDLIPVARRNEHYKAEVCRIAGKALAERPTEEA
jgi:multimeric flavodoxin WrbA